MGGYTPMAEGGKVKATPGGTIVKLAEAGQDEWVVPDSKMGRGGGDINFHFHGPVYGVNDLKRTITETMAEVSRQRNMAAFGMARGGA
jgi:hypothetical protein